MQVRKDNEFEFVLGNRQLFSVLAIIVLLLGVFFAMGFFAGRSVGQAAAKAEENQRRVAENPPIVVDSQAKPETPPDSAAPPVTSAPAESTPPAEAPKSEPPATKAEPQASSAKAAEKAPPPAPVKALPEVNSGKLGKPAPGSYLQVAATTLGQAEAMSALLRKSGLPTVLEESQKAGLIRVLVGPFASAEASNAARVKLKGLGVDNPIPKKY